MVKRIHYNERWKREQYTLDGTPFEIIEAPKIRVCDLLYRLCDSIVRFIERRRERA